MKCPTTLPLCGFMGKVFTLTLAAFLTFSAPTQAGEMLQGALQKLKSHNDPLAKKLLTWAYAIEPDVDMRAPELVAFLQKNPSWPRQQPIREKIEKNIGDTMSSQQTALWFAQNPPSTFHGIRAYVEALSALSKKDEAAAALRTFWKDMPIGQNDMAALAGTYSGWLTAEDHTRRLDTLIWQNRLNEAEYMLAFVPKNIRALGHARISLAQMSRKAEQQLAEVPQDLRNNEGLLFERLRYRRRKNMDTGAAEILRQVPAQTEQADKWWDEINILARRAIEQGHYARAYTIASAHRMTTGTEYGQAEWLLGWLSMMQKKYAQAYAHFDKMYRNVNSAISRSRAAYWAARAAEKMNDAVTSQQWEKLSAQYPSSFYGQLSYAKAYGRPDINALKKSYATSAEWQSFTQREIVRAFILLHKLGLDEHGDFFISRMISDATTPQEFEMLARLARENGRHYYSIQANKDAQQKLGIFLFGEGYPTLPKLPLAYPDKALVHAIIYRESMFKQDARSTAGALGLMQLMPATARQVAGHEGQRYTKERLSNDPQFNIHLGSAYLQKMLDRYDGFYPLAIAAYNAGPGNVGNWIEEMGDPREGRMSVIDWVEHIPIYETRNYIQRVMEAYYMYRLRFNDAPRTILDFGHR